jgi:hypothetical protein
MGTRLTSLIRAHYGKVAATIGAVLGTAAGLAVALLFIVNGNPEPWAVLKGQLSRAGVELGADIDAAEPRWQHTCATPTGPDMLVTLIAARADEDRYADVHDAVTLYCQTVNHRR